MSCAIRRSRRDRTPRGKTIQITARDLAIFDILHRYRYLRSSYIHAFVGGSSGKRFIERLGHLFHEGYIDRPQQQWQCDGARHQPAVHEIGDGGRRVWFRRAGAETSPTTFLSEGGNRQFEHSLLVCATVASLELAVRAQPGLRFIPWPRILAKAPQTTRKAGMPHRMPFSGGSVIPDAVFGIEYGGEERLYRFFAVEVDRATMPVDRSGAGGTSLRRKLEAYQEIIAQKLHQSVWGVPNLLVLTMTVNVRHLLTACRCVDPNWPEAPAFLFKTIGELAMREPDTEILGSAWTRSASGFLAITTASI